MKILLVAINAKYIHSNLAVYSLKAYAEKYACDFKNNENKIEIAEYTINQYPDWILRDIYLKKPDVIGFSCYIWNISMVEEIVENIYKVLPRVHVWFGGPEVSYTAQDFLNKHNHAKGVICGEGEEIFKNVLEAYSDEESTDILLQNIKGISFWNNGKIISNEPEKPIDMSKIPFVYENLSDFENRIIYYESSRGCPFSCSYCLSSIDKQLRFRDIELVKKELKFFIDNRTAQVKFVDRTFNCKREHAMEIWRFIRDNDNGVTNFHFEIAADIMTDEEIALIKTMRPGLIQLEIGVQTTNPTTIQLIDRKMDFAKVSQVVEKLKESDNVHLHLDLIAGLPEEDVLSFENSFNMVYELKPEQLQLGFLKVLHGSKIEEQIRSNEMEFLSRPPYEVLSTKWISYGDVLRLKRVEEVLEIYYNSGQFAASIAELEKYFDTPFEMYDKLGEFYERYGINGEKHSRLQRYEILLDFYKEVIGTEADRKFRIFCQLLTFDLYLRDNIKNRPDFASSREAYKKTITSIYIREEKDRKILPDYVRYSSKQLAKMTHIEVFDFNLEMYLKKGIDKRQDYYILFDYCNRNPLNNGAKVIQVDDRKIDEES